MKNKSLSNLAIKLVSTIIIVYVIAIIFSSFMQWQIVELNPAKWGVIERGLFLICELFPFIVVILAHYSDNEIEPIECPHCRETFIPVPKQTNSSNSTNLAIGLALGTAISS